MSSLKVKSPIGEITFRFNGIEKRVFNKITQLGFLALTQPGITNLTKIDDPTFPFHYLRLGTGSIPISAGSPGLSNPTHVAIAATAARRINYNGTVVSFQTTLPAGTYTECGMFSDSTNTTLLCGAVLNSPLVLENNTNIEIDYRIKFDTNALVPPIVSLTSNNKTMDIDIPGLGIFELQAGFLNSIYQSDTIQVVTEFPLTTGNSDSEPITRNMYIGNQSPLIRYKCYVSSPSNYKRTYHFFIQSISVLNSNFNYDEIYFGDSESTSNYLTSGCSHKFVEGPTLSVVAGMVVKFDFSLTYEWEA